MTLIRIRIFDLDKDLDLNLVKDPDTALISDPALELYKNPNPNPADISKKFDDSLILF